MTEVEIPELGLGSEVVLGVEERRALRGVGDKIRVEWLNADRARLSAAGYVGTVRLSDALTVSITTKVPVANVLALASLAYRVLRLPTPVGEADLREAEPLDWLAFLIVTELESLLARGMRQGYVDIRDELPYVRGRILFERSARQWTHPGLTACEFADFLPDTAENQVLRATLEALGSSRLLPGLHARVMAAAEWLSDVTVRPPSLRLLNDVRLTRLNSHYRPALELCRLYLEGRAVEQPTGDVAAPAFLFPMAQVFEAAVANFLKRTVAGVRVQPERSLAPTNGEPSHVLSFRPDLLVGDGPALVLDTKYANPERRTRFGTRSFRNDDLYQIAFYANEYGCPGLLVYPRAERDVDVTFETAGARCGLATINLSQPGLAGMEAFRASVQALLGKSVRPVPRAA